MAVAKKRKYKPLTDEQKRTRSIKSEFRNTLRNIGFFEITECRDFEIEFMGEKTDVDGVFIKENVVILAEYTTTGDPVGHLKKKKTTYDKIINNQNDFIDYLKGKCAAFKEACGTYYTGAQFKIKIIYRSYRSTSNDLKNQVPCVKCVDGGHMAYFRALSGSIKGAALFEWLDYIGFDFTDFMPSKPTQMKQNYHGSLLPESHSNFNAGYKIVSFYVDPLNVLQRSYVLRKEGWKDTTGVYQRMIEKKKIEAIRNYLFNSKRVFINNIIVTLSDNTKILDENSNTVDFSKITKTTPVRISLPDEYNSIGIIDGQHRVFSYHESGTNDKIEAAIKPMRTQQNLLVTGIVYPSGVDEAERARFEAELFLEINSNQTNAKSDLKQAIGVLLKPYSTQSIARMILDKINEDSGPLGDRFERASYETGKIKTSSIVSFGLRNLIKFEGNDTLYAHWNNANKSLLLSNPNASLRKDYVQFCFETINGAFIAVKKSIPAELWTSDRAVDNRFLTTTNIIGMLIFLRIMIENNNSIDVDSLTTLFKNKLSKFDYSSYHSSQYGRLARELYATLQPK